LVKSDKTMKSLTEKQVKVLDEEKQARAPRELREQRENLTEMPAKVLHEPQLDTILMVEKAIINAKEYLTRKQLWQSLPKKMQYQTFKRILDYLEASGQIAFNTKRIIYTGANNPKLKALIESSIKIR
jgi:hypothetical protein